MEMRSERRALDKLYKRRDRYEIPDWQRDKVWTAEKKRKLIDSVLRGWKLPKFYFQKTNESPDEFDVVDGQQRLTAIWDFLDGKLTLSPTTAADFGGATCKDLPDSVSDRFDDYEIEYDEITNATDEEVREFFQRLQEGLPLTSSEKLNSVPSKLRDYCARTAEAPFFSKTTVIANKRYAYFDIVAKVATLEIEGLDAGLRYEDVLKVFESSATFSPQSAAAERIDGALKFLSDSFPQPFKPFRNRTIVQSVITVVCHLQTEGLTTGQGDTLRDFIEHFLNELGSQVELGQKATDPDFLDFQRTVNANVKSGPKTRQTILVRKLFERHPEFYTSLSQSAGLADGINDSIASRATSIRDLIAAINERYAAQNGRDLFKATNKTATALTTSLSSPATSLEEYKTFVENLYFVFRESTGDRLVGQLPPSFVDVNDLRTMLQHDLDHGDSTKAAAKRKRLASVFKRYSGGLSPVAVDPSAFPLTQTNILAALESDLRALEKSLN